MSDEIDYDLAADVGARWFFEFGGLAAITDFGGLCVWDFNVQKWTCEPSKVSCALDSGLKPIPPRPEVKEPECEYEPVDYGGNHWKAGQAESLGVELYNKLKTYEYKLVKGQALAVALSESGTLYSRKENKRDWRDEVVFDGVDKCELTENLIIDESFNKAGAVKLAKAILKAVGDDA